MGGFLKYTGIFIVAVMLLQLIVFDSMQVWLYFCPLAYIAFIVLLPVNAKPLAVLFLGFATGLFMDFFEGTGGLHTAATLFTAYTRRWVMMLTLGREQFEEGSGMPSPKSFGGGKFLRYALAVVFIHCLFYFSLETLSLQNYLPVMIKTGVSGVFTLASVWATALLFSAKTRKRA